MLPDAPIDGPDGDGPGAEAVIALPRDERSVKVARDEVAGRLRQAGWREEAVERARVVASELAANALAHAGSGFGLEIRLQTGDHEVWIGVADEAPDPPAYAERPPARVGGMGLYLVDALAASWGVDVGPGGKVVWARLHDGPWAGDAALV